MATEWQMHFRRETFRRLVLSCSCVGDFRQRVQSRKHLVKHIWLRVELPEYRCSTCGNSETARQFRKNDQIFTNVLWHLMETLGAWGEAEPCGQGPILELSVHSPSDLKHHFD
ncbi:hypothetical protein Trco_001600 [Trichoderma cornu-damae]|uniref:C2H2-type domain-containing protein n=1 Tax=Trichoderma cornu-damae TaxID=654480 RepID=A0A9P8QXL5_9HYPO|nr:hypothetical protein Trco_001600 [Trichoderma cornu-damae]